MVKKRIHNNGYADLCETYSTDDLNLLQTETGIIYGSTVIDTLDGYDEKGNPYCKYTYIEADDKKTEVDELTRQKAQAYDIIVGGDD